MILYVGSYYLRRDGRIELIGGTVRDHPDWSWSCAGNWYETATGNFVAFTPLRGHYVCDPDHIKSLRKPLTPQDIKKLRRVEYG